MQSRKPRRRRSCPALCWASTVATGHAVRHAAAQRLPATAGGRRSPAHARQARHSVAQRCAASHPTWFLCRTPKGLDGSTSPVQARWRCCFTLRTATWVCRQPPYLGGLQIVAIVVLRQRDGRGTVRMACWVKAVYQFATAATDHDAFRRHAVKTRQLRTAHRCSAGQGIAPLCGLQRLHGRWAWPAGIAVGGKVMRGHAQRVGAAMHHQGVLYITHPYHRITAIKTIASSASNTCTRTTLDAKPTARCTSMACGHALAGSAGTRRVSTGAPPGPAPCPPWASRRWARRHRRIAPQRRPRRRRGPPAPATLP